MVENFSLSKLPINWSTVCFCINLPLSTQETAIVIRQFHVIRQLLEKPLVFGHLTESIFCMQEIAELKQPSAKSNSHGEGLVKGFGLLQPGSVANVEGRAAETYLGFTTLGTPG